MQRGVFLAIKYGSQAMTVTSEEKMQPGGVFVVTGSCASYLGSYSDLPYGEYEHSAISALELRAN